MFDDELVRDNFMETLKMSYPIATHLIDEHDKNKMVISLMNYELKNYYEWYNKAHTIMENSLL